MSTTANNNHAPPRSRVEDPTGTALVYRNAQTIGKKLCGIKVARLHGSRATPARIADTILIRT
jgi:hypothetical protein